MRRKLLPVEDCVLLSLYRETGSANEVALLVKKRFGITVTRPTVIAALKRLGVGLPRGRQIRDDIPSDVFCAECGERFSISRSRYKVAKHRAEKSGRPLRLFCSKVCVYTFTSRENSGKTPTNIDTEPTYRHRKPEDPRDTVYLVEDEGGVKTLKNGPLEPEGNE